METRPRWKKMAAPIRIVCTESLPVKIIKWKVKKDSVVMKGSILGLYESSETKSQVKLKSSATGIVDEIYAEAGAECQPGTLLMTIQLPDSGGCTHQTVMKEMCADCGADLRRLPGVVGDCREKMTASVAMVHNIPELIVSQKQALELGREDEERLLKNRKLVLLVDLDQTLIHTTNDNIPPKLKDVYHFQLWQGPQSSWYHTRLRPHTHRFLEHVSKMYELHICTFGVRLYAHTVARLMDPDEKFFSHRILSRDECFDPLSKTANLKALFPCGDAMVCIIDDREDVWNRAPNLVHVKPYRFFQGTADINAPPGLEKSENDDIPLVHKVIDHHDHNASQGSESEQKGCEKTQKTEGADSPSTEDHGESGELRQEEAMETSNEAAHNGTEGRRPGEAEVHNVNADKTEMLDNLKSASECDDSVERNCAIGQESVGEVSSFAGLPSSENSAQADLDEDLCVSSDSDSQCEGSNHSDSDRINLENGGSAVSPDAAALSDPATVEDKTNASECVTTEEKISPFSSITTHDPLGMSENLATQSETTLSDNIVTQDTTSQSNTTAKQDETKSVEKATEEQRAENSTDTPQPAEPEEESRETPKSNVVSGSATQLSQTSQTSVGTETGKEDGTEEVEWDDEDDYLLHLEDILTRIHHAYYAMIDEKRRPSPTPDFGAQQEAAHGKRSLPDLKSIIPYVRRKALKGCKIVLSGMVPLNSPPENSPAYLAARALGATVQRDIVGPRDAGKKGEATTHLVAAKPGTSKHKTAMKTRGVHVVNSDWLWVSRDRWERCDERLFPLGPDASSSSASSASQQKDDTEDERKRSKRKLKSKDHADSDTKGGKNTQKRQKTHTEDEDEEDGNVNRADPSCQEGTSQEEVSQEGTSQEGGRRSSTFADSMPPLMAFSDEDLECMDKEVDELMAEEGTSSADETDNERDQRYRDTVLGSVSESSSSDSLSGDLPRGWGLRRKSKSSPHTSEDDLEKRKHEEIEVETEDTENELVRFQNTIDAFSPDSDSDNSSYAESIGSVDDELAEAVEKEFLGGSS